MKKLFLITIILLVLTLSFSCSVIKTYEDTNGDDNYNLQTITSEMIMNKNGGLEVGSVSSQETKNNITSILLNVTKFDGIKSLYRFNKGTYGILVAFKATKGNGKLVITDGKKIIYEFVINEENQMYEFDCAGTSYLKVAGESLEFELTVKVEKK